MMQFKFGDRVKRKSDGAIGVVVDTKFQSIWVVFEGSAVSDFYDDDEFEIIPHPDTVRLEFIAAECDSTLDELREVLDKKQ
nr:MAG TPA: hypothetical protein [Caudoviricetes sp.]